MKSFVGKFSETLRKGLRSPSRVIGLLLLVVLIIIGWGGFASSRAIEHEQKACNIIIPIGQRLKPHDVYGSGATSVSSEERVRLDAAWKEADAAFATDRRHFGNFGEAVGYFVINIDPIEGVPINPEDKASPYDLYIKVIRPTCIKTMHLNNLQKLNLWRH